MSQKNNNADPSRTLRQRYDDDPGRARRFSLKLESLLADYSRRHLDDDGLARLEHEARAADLDGAIRSLFAGGIVNLTENRPALHWALRADPAALPGSIRRDCHDWRRPANALAEALRAGEWRNARDEPLADLLCLGIGGSETGPRLAIEALGGDGPALHFLANVDGGPLERVLGALDPARTAVLVTSKSFGTVETLANARVARDWLSGAGLDPANHLLAATARRDLALEFGVPASRVFGIPEGVGGRFSLWSAAGFPVLAALGPDGFDRLLAGARVMDAHFREASFRENLPSVLGSLDARCPALAVVPYDERLARLPEYLQQLYMESLGKGVAADGNPLPDYRPPVVFGDTGTRAQHAFFQALHQSNLAAVTEFIGVANAGHGYPAHQDVLLANLLGQATALAFGSPDEENDPHRACQGNRESNVLLLNELTPETLGGLLALYEHRVFVAGTLAGINPFDQFGVELGKRLEKDVLSALAGDFAPPASLSFLLDAIGRCR